jgi:hypothetical protein
MMLGATLGILGGLVVERVLETMAYPGNFALLFGLAFAATMISYAFLTQLREDDDGIRPRSIRFMDYLGEIPSILRANRTFRNFLVADALLAMVIMAEAFYTIYAFQKFDLTAGFAGRFTVMVMASMVIGNLHLRLPGGSSRAPTEPGRDGRHYDRRVPSGALGADGRGLLSRVHGGGVRRQPAGDVPHAAHRRDLRRARSGHVHRAQQRHHGAVLSRRHRGRHHRQPLRLRGGLRHHGGHRRHLRRCGC